VALVWNTERISRLLVEEGAEDEDVTAGGGGGAGGAGCGTGAGGGAAVDRRITRVPMCPITTPIINAAKMTVEMCTSLSWPTVWLGSLSMSSRPR